MLFIPTTDILLSAAHKIFVTLLVPAILLWFLFSRQQVKGICATKASEGMSHRDASDNVLLKTNPVDAHDHVAGDTDDEISSTRATLGSEPDLLAEGAMPDSPDSGSLPSGELSGSTSSERPFSTEGASDASLSLSPTTTISERDAANENTSKAAPNYYVPQDISKYTSWFRLGRGGCGSVVGAVLLDVPNYPQPYTTVAVKTMLRRHARREIVALKKLHDKGAYPHVVMGYQWIHSGIVTHVIYPLYFGGSLDKIIGRVQLPEDQLATMTYAIMEGLHHMHCLQLIHRDVKPNNIFLTMNGRVLIGDYSHTHCYAAPVAPDDIEPKSIVGTLGYMAPELWREDKNYNYLVDYFSLGCLLVDVIFDALPFEELEPTWCPKLKCMVFGDLVFPPTPQLSDATYAFIRALLAFPPNLRQQSVYLADKDFCALASAPLAAIQRGEYSLPTLEQAAKLNLKRILEQKIPKDDEPGPLFKVPRDVLEAEFETTADDLERECVRTEEVERGCARSGGRRVCSLL